MKKVLSIILIIILSCSFFPLNQVSAAPEPISDFYIEGNGTPENNWVGGKDWEEFGLKMNCIDRTCSYKTRVPAGTYKFQLRADNGTNGIIIEAADCFDEENSTPGYTVSGNVVTFKTDFESNVFVEFAVAVNGKKTLTLKYNMYDIEMEEGIEHGTVTSVSSANAGDEVELALNPDENYQCRYVAVYKTDDPKTYINVKDNKFIMPDCDVTVEARFVDPFYLPPDDGYSVVATTFGIEDVLDYIQKRLGARPTKKTYVAYEIEDNIKYAYYDGSSWSLKVYEGFQEFFAYFDNNKLLGGDSYFLGYDADPASFEYVYIGPESTVYDGNAKEVELIQKPFVGDEERFEIVQYYCGDKKLDEAPSDAGTYTVKMYTGYYDDDESKKVLCSYTLTDEKWTFTIEEADATYTVTAPETTEWVYDGSEHGDAAVSDDNGVTITYRTKLNSADEYGTESSEVPKLKDAGKLYVLATAKKDNYKAVSVDYVLEVTKRPITLTSGSADKIYDGTPLTCSTVTITGDGYATGEEFEITVTGSNKDPGTVSNTFTYEAKTGTKLSNYEVIEEYGKLTVNAAVNKSETDFEMKGETAVKSVVKNEGIDLRFGIDENISVLGEKVSNVYGKVNVYDGDTTLAQGRDYTVTSGSIILTFTKNYVNSLSVGKHSYTVVINTSETDSYTYKVEIIVNPKVYAVVNTSVK